MSEQLEQKIIGSILTDPSLLNLYEINSKWFTTLRHQQLIQTLVDNGGAFSDFAELEYQVRSKFPVTQVTEDWLQMEQYSAVRTQDFKASLQTLKAIGLQERARKATEAYAKTPTEKNLLSLQDRLRELQELEQRKSTGELNHMSEKLLWQLENDKEPGLLSFNYFDNVLGGGLHGGNLLTIGGRPGTGKSAWGINLLLKIIEKQPNTHADFFNLEMKDESVYKRFISRLTGINSYKFRNPKLALTLEEKNRVIKSDQYLTSTQLRIHDTLHTLGEITRQIRHRHHEAGDDKYIAVVDYLGLIHYEDHTVQRHLQIAEMTRTFKLLANELDITIVLFSQLNREVEKRPNNKPNLSDLRESGSIEQDSSIIGFLYKDKEEQGKVYLDIAKNRDGRTATIPYRFHGASMLFEEEPQ